MDVITPWLTPAVMLAIFTWLRLDIRDFAKEVGKRFDEVNKRIDGVSRELAGLRERVAKLEGWLERDRRGAPDRDAV